MRLFNTIAALRCYLSLCRNGNLPENRAEHYQQRHPVDIGLVPTMGALHQGHLSLIERARQDNQVVIVSIFVNPLQFGPQEDFHHYPRTLEQDRELCERAGVDAIFAPSVAEMDALTNRPEGQTQVLPPATMLNVMCGRFRPGHFPGVATIVTKLLNLVQPNRAYFGQKDAQQVAIIQRLVADLNIPVEIVPCPIVRESDGLAYSSRNQYLNPVERQQATVLYRGLQQAAAAFRAGERLSLTLIETVKGELATVPQVQPEYIELVHPKTLMPLDQVDEVGLLGLAVRLGTTRLIDNLCLRHRRPIVAIDGPAGAGKSTVARRVARAINLLYLDTGAMYRALTWLVLQAGIGLDDQPAVAELVSQCEIEFGDRAVVDQESCIYINGHDVTQAIRSQEVTANVSAIAAQPAVRQQLVRQQQRYGQRGGLVMEGRDIGTCVFPDAELKIFLTASVQERARRRQQDLKNRGQGEIDLETLEQAIDERDRRDSTRAVSPLRQASDAIEMTTDHLTIDQVVDQIVALYHQRLHN